MPASARRATATSAIPTRSGIHYPSRSYRRRGEAESARAATARRPSLRKVRARAAEHGEAGRQRRKRHARKTAPTAPAPRTEPTEATEELRQHRRPRRDRAAGASSAAPPRRSRPATSATRCASCVRCATQYPDAAAVRELLGLCHYRLGQYPAAAKELERVRRPHRLGRAAPGADGLRAGAAEVRHASTSLWDELAAASPSAALVTEGRIVLAGSLADRGRLRDAIALLDRRGAATCKRPAEHHLRLWYALADLYERAGDLPRARELFDRVRRADPSFADVAERRLALG